MILRFSGIETPITINGENIAVVEIHNPMLFSRCAQALLSKQGETAVEPFSLWNDDGSELSINNSLIAVANPLVLPWDDKSLIGSLQANIELMVLEDETIRQKIEYYANNLNSIISQLGFQIQGEYQFALEWELRKYLKAFAFGIDYDSNNSLIENLIKFVDYYADVAPNKALVFINLKTFLKKSDIIRLYERILFQKINVLCLETVEDKTRYGNELKITVNQDFLEII